MYTQKQGHLTEIKVSTGVDVNKCYQCGKCSAGCAVNDEMDFPPSVVMRMLQTNDYEDYNTILNSQSIWLCVSCENCLTRCPMQIDIPRLMDFLREEALEKKTANKKAKNVIAFHRSFLESIRLTGRLYEIGLVAGYKMRTLNLLQDVNVAPAMFMKGKLPVLPEVVKDKKQIKTIFSRTKK